MSRKLLSLSLLILILILAFGGAARAQDKTLYWQRYDVDLTPQTNGDLHVAETQELVFTNGTFRYGQRAIPLNRLGEIKNVQVRELDGPVYENAETDAPYTYRVFQEGGETRIRYNFPPTSDSRRTIVIDYDVTDALRYYPENGVDQLYWKAVPAGNPFPTQSSTITLHAPEGATFTNYGLYGTEGEAELPAWPAAMPRSRCKGRIDPGEEVEVVAEWPARHRGRPAAGMAARAGSAGRGEEGPTGIPATLGAGLRPGLPLAGRAARSSADRCCSTCGGIARAATHPVGLIADYLPEPPSDLPAGMVGTLIDESADMQDILATHPRPGAARRAGDRGDAGARLPGDRHHHRLHLSPEVTFLETLRPYEETLLDNMFGKRQGGQALRSEEQILHRRPDAPQAALRGGRERGLLRRATPKRFAQPTAAWASSRWSLAIVGGFFFAAVLAHLSGFALCVPLGL